MTDPAAALVGGASVSRHSRWWWALVPVAVLAGIGATPFGGWVQSFFYGTGARWQDAYPALEAAESQFPPNVRERERLLLANAMVEGEPPVGLKSGPRLHRAGTLARLKYETFDEHGARMDEWEVRALVPNIGNGEGPFWREPCAKACQDEAARGAATRIHRSGEPGIAEEYVLRMPVGQAFELRPTFLRTQDILDAQPRRVALRSVRIDARSVQVPSKILVTLVAACSAEVRVGTAINLEVFPNAIIPIPSGFRVSRWAQLDGCGKLEPFPPPPADVPPVFVQPVIPEPPDLHAVVTHRDAASGYASLRVDEAWLTRHNKPVVFRVNVMCRYDAAADAWQRLPVPDGQQHWRLVPQSPEAAARGNRVAFEAPIQIALFWLRWSEQSAVNSSSRDIAYRDALVMSGPVQCNDIHPGEAPPGKVAACVPFAERAEARFVPAPEKACGR